MLYEEVEFADAQTPYDCCATCIGTPNCGGTSFKSKLIDQDTEGGICTGLMTVGDCDLGNLVGFFDRSPAKVGEQPVDYVIHVSSGYCGYMGYGDADQPLG